MSWKINNLAGPLMVDIQVPSIPMASAFLSVLLKSQGIGLMAHTIARSYLLKYHGHGEYLLVWSFRFPSSFLIERRISSCLVLAPYDMAVSMLTVRVATPSSLTENPFFLFLHTPVLLFFLVFDLFITPFWVECLTAAEWDVSSDRLALFLLFIEITVMGSTHVLPVRSVRPVSSGSLLSKPLAILVWFPGPFLRPLREQELAVHQ